MKTLRTWAVLVSFLFLSIVSPMRAYAFAPPALGWLGSAAFATEGAALAPLAANPLGAAVVALGAGYMLWKASQWNACEGIALIARAACTPAGWSKDGAGNLQPPASTSQGSVTTTYQYQVVLSYYWIADYATAATLETVKSNLCKRAGLTYAGGNRCVDYKYDSTYMTITAGTYNVASPSCPAGYVVSGTSCTLSNVAAVKKPAGTPCQVMVNGGAFTYDPQNPDCPATAPGTKQVNGISYAVSADGKTMTLTGTDGATAVITIASPAITIQQNLPMADENGSPVTQKSKTTLNTSTGTPVITQQYITYQNGQGEGVQEAPALDCSMISNCDWAKSSIQQQQLALQQQQLQAENTIKDKTTAIADAFTTTREAPATSTATDATSVTNQLSGMKQSEEAYRGPLTTILNKLGIPTSGGQCQLSRQITLFGHTFTLNFVQPGFCDMYQPIANWTSWVLIVAYAWNTLRRQPAQEA